MSHNLVNFLSVGFAAQRGMERKEHRGNNGDGETTGMCHPIHRPCYTMKYLSSEAPNSKSKFGPRAKAWVTFDVGSLVEVTIIRLHGAASASFPESPTSIYFWRKK